MPHASTARFRFMLAMAGLLVATTCQHAEAQSVGGPCNPPGTATQYEENGMLVCGVNMHWHVAIKSTPPAAFGNEAGIATMAQDRFGNTMRMVVENLKSFMTEILSPE